MGDSVGFIEIVLLLTACSASSKPTADADEMVLLELAAANECGKWQTLHPEWVFCDDFESTGPLVAAGRYFEYGDNDGGFVPRDSVGVRFSRGMRARWQVGEVGAGGFKLGFGRNPNRYMDKGIRRDEDFHKVYYRMYLKHQEGWRGSPAKLSRHGL